jgi:hypothetical protein
MIPAQLKQAFKSKTVQYGVAIAVLSVLQVLGCGIAGGIVVLRFMTTMPVSNK